MAEGLEYLREVLRTRLPNISTMYQASGKETMLSTLRLAESRSAGPRKTAGDILPVTDMSLFARLLPVFCQSAGHIGYYDGGQYGKI